MSRGHDAVVSGTRYFSEDGVEDECVVFLGAHATRVKLISKTESTGDVFWVPEVSYHVYIPGIFRTEHYNPS